MLDIQDLHVSYGPHEALAGVTLNVDAGEIVVILGANGAGKSSLLQAIAGISEGEVRGGIELDSSAIDGLTADRIVESGVAFVPEGRGIFGDLSVQENLLLGAYSEHARPAQQANLALVYDLFPKLLDRSKQISSTMSGGEQQMVAIGRALMSNPKYLLLDEPSLGLSPLLCKELFQSLRHIRDSGISVLMVEQNARQSLAIADRCYLIENGAITGGGEAAAMLNDPAVQAAYLGGASGSAADKKPESTSIKPKKEIYRTYITPGKGKAVVQAIPIGEFVFRATQQTADAKSRTIQQLAGRTDSDRKPNLASINLSHDQQVSELLASFESAAVKARINQSENSATRESKENGVNTPFPAPPAVARSVKQSVEINKSNQPVTLPKKKRQSSGNMPGVQIFRRGADGKLQQVNPVLQQPNSQTSNTTQLSKQKIETPKVFRRGADGKLHPVRR